MTDIETKALALVNEVRRERGFEPHLRLNRERYEDEAICRAIEQHEAFKREVSDAIDSSVLTPETEAHLSRFIIAKPDPLVEVWDHMIVTGNFGPLALRTALAARGGRIVWEGE